MVVSVLCFVMWHCQRIDDVCQCKDKMISLNCVCAECFFKILSEKADDNTSSYFLNDNTDNNDNGKNGRNCGCHKVTYNTDNGITSATEKLLLLLLLILSLLS